jgi:hypothetical protein
MIHDLGTTHKTQLLSQLAFRPILHPDHESHWRQGLGSCGKVLDCVAKSIPPSQVKIANTGVETF